MSGLKIEEGIALLSGVLFNYQDPGACEVEIEDIASALSNVCRFAGHLPCFYSVAQHAVNASYIAPAGHEFAALMHDTAEAFTNDLPSPLKWAFPVFKELEVSIETAMSSRFGFEYPLSPEVRLVDLQMLKLEKEGVKGDPAHWEMLDGIETDDLIHLVDLESWVPSTARRLFLARYRELRP